MTADPAPSPAAILLVEDDEMIMDLVRNLLELSGYTVMSTYLPDVALELVRQSSIHMDLLLTDLVMPQMNGTELYRRVLDHRPDLPVLYMSGYSDNSVGALLDGGRFGFVSKPFTPSVLLEKIEQLLGAEAWTRAQSGQGHEVLDSRQ